MISEAELNGGSDSASWYDGYDTIHVYDDTGASRLVRSYS